MKKIILLLFLSFFSISGYSQLALEGFESTTGPDALPSTNWTLGTGNWAVFDNNTPNTVGLVQRWGINSAVTTPPVVYQGTNAAQVDRENIGVGNTSEDYLATPLVTVPTNGELRFFTRSAILGDQGTIYKIMIAPGNNPANQTNPNAYSDVAQWTEAELNATFNIYEQKVVSLSGYATQQVYVAFVRVKNQTVAGINGSGDRWLVDNVAILEKCLDPTGGTANTITQTSANLTWANPSGATSWEIEVIPSTSNPTGTGIVYNGALPFVAITTALGAPLTPNTPYKYYVRALCSSGASSQWAGPYPFTTAKPGISCASPISIATLPYSTNDNTSNYLDTYDTAQPTACAGTVTNYMGGNDVFYTFTPTFTGNVSITMTPGASNSGIFVYQGCANVGVTCLAGVANTGSGVRTIASLAVTAGTTYIIVLSSTTTTQTYGYSLVIQQVNCSPPTAPVFSNLAQTSVQLSWGNPSGATSWEVAVQAAGSPIPSGPGTTANTNTNFPISGLTPNTTYQYYVRADCGNGTFSAWTLSSTFTTLCAAFNTPFIEGFNSTSTTQSCWTVLNVNNDTDLWNMNYATNPYEGDECAMLYTDFNAGANNDWLISPQINLTGNQRLKFRYRVQSATEPNEFRVMLSTTGTTPASFTNILVPLATYSNTTYIQSTVSLVNYMGPVNIGWHVPPGTLDGWRIYIDEVIVEDLPTCPEVTAVAATNLLSTSATISWTNGNTETAWQVLALPCGSPAPTATTTGFVDATSNPFNLNSLIPNTCYDIYVRAVCSATDSSVWSAPTTIKTLCAPFNVPFFEGFNSNSTSQSCWTVLNVNNDADSWNMDYTTNPYEGNECAMMYTDFNAGANNDWLISPQINLTPNQRLKFRYRVQSATEPNEFRVMLSTTGASPANFTDTLVPLTTYSNITYAQKIVSLAGYTGPVNIGWQVPPGTLDGWRIYIDEVIIESIPTCPEPSAIVVSNKTQTGATIAWTNGGTETAWQVLALPCGSPAPTATSTGFVDATTNPFNLTGLTPATCYDVYVRAVCSTTDIGPWSAFTSFSTIIANDECSVATATTVQVNLDGTCALFSPGTVNGATASAQGNTCAGTDDDDVWFQFVATATTQSISLINVAGSTTDLFHVLYSGSCGSLTQLYCSDPNSSNATGLTVGQTYYIRVYSYSSTAQTTTFNVCIKAPILPPSCSTLTPASDVCTTAPPICNLNGYCGNTSAAYNADAWTELAAAFCGASIENDSYITFQANATTVTLNVWVTTSQNGDGIQMLFFSVNNNNCSGAVTAYGCYNPLAPGGNTPYQITATGLIPGNTYYLVIDGYAGDVCNYVVSVPSNGGISTNVAVTTTNSNVCLPNTQTTLTASGGSGIYNWTVTPPTTGLSASTGSTVTFTPTSAGTYTVTATSTDGNLNCPQATSDSKIITVNDAPVGTFTLTQPTCAVQTGSLNVDSPISQTAYPTPSNLFISEVTDANTGSLTYVELYNRTGAAINLSNYSLKFYTAGTVVPPLPSISCNLSLSGTINNNSTFVIAVGSATNQGGVVPNLVFANTCGGVNNNDNIRLTTSAGVEIDLWGRTDGVSFTPLDQPGYTYRRNFNAIAPSLTWNPADWTALDPEDYSNVGTYTLPLLASFQYSVDGGTYQSNPLFTLLTSGPHTLLVKDANTGCISLPIPFTIDPVPLTNNPVTTFSYVTPVCKNSIPNPTPNTSATGFTTGGRYSEITTTGLVFVDSATNSDSSTGEIDLVNSTTGLHTIQYTILPYIAGCQAGGTYTFDITINPIVTPIIGFSYTTPICKNAQPSLLSPSLAPGFTAGGTFTATSSTGGVLTIDATTGVVNLATSDAGTYSIVYTVNANPSICQVANDNSLAPFTLEIKPIITPVVDFSYDTPICYGQQNISPILVTGFTTGGTFTPSSASLSVNGQTGEISNANSSGNYTVTYTVGPDPQSCRIGGTSNPVSVLVSNPIDVNITGECQGVKFVLTANPVNNSFVPDAVTYEWKDSLGIIVGTNSQTLEVSTPGLYTVTINSNNCLGTDSDTFNTVVCQIQKGISANGDGKNDTFDLTGFNVKKLTLFNRYGMKVYSKDDYTDQWKGQSDKGDDLPDGTYYYVIERSNGESPTGWVYINRAQ